MKISTALYEKRRKFSTADLRFYPKMDVGRGRRMGGGERWEMR